MTIHLPWYARAVDYTATDDGIAVRLVWKRPLALIVSAVKTVWRVL